MSLTLQEYLQNHPYGRLDATGFPDPSLAYAMNKGENVLVDITVTTSGGDPIPQANIKNVLITLRREETVNASWSWISDGAQSDQIDVEDGHVYLEMTKEDTDELAGLYDLEVQLSIINTDFFDTGAQTDVMEANSALFVRVVPVNAPTP